MKILFAFENVLPSLQADAEVFTATAGRLAVLATTSWFHAPGRRDAGDASPPPDGTLEPVRAFAPARPAILRHFCCGLTIATRRAFRAADLVYTRNLWVAAVALFCGQRVVFDHYRPWPDQIPPLQPLLRAVMGHRRFLLNICHSEYTRTSYLALGVPTAKLACIRNGHAPERLRAMVPRDEARATIGIPVGQRTVVYTGRINGRKGLDLLLAAAARLPDLLFVLVGSVGDGPIERAATVLPNVRLVPWQSADGLASYLSAADVLVIPPSSRPLAEFGTTVLPLKLFLYMASGRPILAGATPDNAEMLRHGENAYLCRPDDPDALVAGLRALTVDEAFGRALGATARAESLALTWDARARRIVAAIDERRRAAADAPPLARGIAQRRRWRRHCARWLVHLLRSRSLILPPAGADRDGGRLAASRA